MRGDLVGDDAVFHVLLVREAEVFLGRDQHRDTVAFELHLGKRQRAPVQPSGGGQQSIAQAVARAARTQPIIAAPMPLVMWS